MTVLEVRRHSTRKHTGGSQLSQEGVDLARRIGASMGPYDLVVSSVVPRARETALAMGFAVDHEVHSLIPEDGVFSESLAAECWLAERPFAAIADLIAQEGSFHRYAYDMAAQWRDLMTPRGPEDTVLLVGHSGDLECALVAALPHADHGVWGAMFGVCEGARLTFDGGRFRSAEILRVEETEIPRLEETA